MVFAAVSRAGLRSIGALGKQQKWAPPSQHLYRKMSALRKLVRAVTIIGIGCAIVLAQGPQTFRIYYAK